jgi:nucleotide-binding universal stress UspA family protein
MLEIKTILCPVDFSEFSARAYRHALSLAEHYGARLIALNTVELYQFTYLAFAASAGLYDEFCKAAHENGKTHLHKFVETNNREGVNPELVVHQGIAPDYILQFAETQKADLIVMGTHGRRGYDRLMLGSVTDRVMRKSSCPVLAVCRSTHEAGSMNEHAKAPHRLTRILACTDFSASAKRALQYAVSGAEEYGAELTLLHVLEGVSNPSKAKEAEAMAELEKLIPADLRTNLSTKMVVRGGKPYQQIIQQAEETQADLVAIGVSGRGNLDVAVFGSTTYRVMQLGPCPVLAVRA